MNEGVQGLLLSPVPAAAALHGEEAKQRSSTYYETFKSDSCSCAAEGLS